MATLDNDKVTGVSTVLNADNAANKQYVDSLPKLQDVTGNSGKFLNYSPTGTIQWKEINSTSTSSGTVTYKGYQEFTTPGSYTFYIPPTATIFYIEVIGGGGGGGGGRATGSGSGGGGGVYSSWLIKRGELGNSSTMNVSVGTGGVGGSGINLVSSTNAIEWSSKNPRMDNIYSLNYLNNTYYFATGTGGGISTSPDGLTWTARTSGSLSNTSDTILYSSTFGKSLYVVAGGRPFSNTYTYMAVSTNAIQWTFRTTPVSSATGLIFGNNLFIASGGYYGADTAVSTDTISWVLRTTGVSINYTSSRSVFAYGTVPTSSYIMSNGNDYTNIRHSTDSIVWTLRTLAIDTKVLDIAFVNNIYLLACFYGILQVSTDSITWTLRTSGIIDYYPYVHITAIKGSTNGYIFGTSNGMVRTSTDTIVWTTRTSGTTNKEVGRSVALINNNTYLIGVLANTSGTSGSSSTVSWIGNSPTGTTPYSLSSESGGGGDISPGNSSSESTRNPIKSITGSNGGAGLTAVGISSSSTQSTSMQITGGGGGAYGPEVGGSGATGYYGNTYSNGGNNSGGNGGDGIPGSYTGNIGGGGGGGGASSTIPGNGGNGTRGGGGGGGGFAPTTGDYGLGGNGGPGYVKITWW